MGSKKDKKDQIPISNDYFMDSQHFLEGKSKNKFIIVQSNHKLQELSQNLLQTL